MNRQLNIDVPMYRKIALDMAGRICRGEFKEGDRIYGRSTLAGEYNVSPETVRRAVTLLEDMKVVKVSQGSGIRINSKQNAFEFIQRFENKESISSLRSDIKSLLAQKQSIEHEINSIVSKIIDYSDRLKNADPISPLEIEMDDDSHLIGKTVTDSKFWQNTGGTIIGIRRNGKLILSPGPYLGFEKGDHILVVGQMDVLERIKSFMKE
ncbi:GntR family transcriptional regulator [Anaerobacterium chartisolvens]|uniref:GntR family transcriptional regulator n=1 Tax=Anaerobacterium chartisolvens TaxID=1297424 RepID=A0A369BMU0_9FIRM|nr:TrkA C-terminal domain-containing protein [Anaerobacterium chartisolvens]RCX20994.1 GntR family transcriptional regulator [Anaerobacterium chartisolvens]